MKHSFKLSKPNIIYILILVGILIFLNIRIYGFDSYVLSFSLGSVFWIVLISTLLALLFWYILGRKEKGGTTTFNIIMTLMLLGSIGEFVRIIIARNQSTESVKKAVSDYK